MTFCSDFLIKNDPQSNSWVDFVQIGVELVRDDQVSSCHFNNESQGGTGAALRVFLPVLSPAGTMIDVHGRALHRHYRIHILGDNQT